MMFLLRSAWSFAVAWIGSWWAGRRLRKAAEADGAAEVSLAYVERDKAALMARNNDLTHQLEEKRDEPAPTSYDGDADRLARFVHEHAEVDLHR